MTSPDELNEHNHGEQPALTTLRPQEDTFPKTLPHTRSTRGPAHISTFFLPDRYSSGSF